MSRFEQWASNYVATMQLARTFTSILKLIVAIVILIEVLS